MALTDSVSAKISSEEIAVSAAGGDGNPEGKGGIMIMGEAEDRVDLVLCKNHLSKPGISGSDDLCPTNLGHEVAMGPVTPFPDRENQVVSSPSGQSEEADLGSVCQTPMGSIFNPFAPGPEELMFAPKKKMQRKTCPPIRRQLNFDSCCYSEECSVDTIIEETLEEESFLETVYRSFLNVIVPPRISLSEEITVSDASVPEWKCGVGREYTEGREGMDLSESCLSKAGISGVDDICVSQTVNKTVLGPLTPFPERKNLQLSSPIDQTEEGDLGSDSQTPRESTFDPFAPVPEGLLMFAPKKKLLKETHVSVQRELNFASCCDSEENLVYNISEETSEEEIFLVTVYRSLLDVIISCQVGEFVGESLLADSTPFDGLKTPTSLPLLNGIAETCPDAPVRPTSKSRKFSVNICRKLEF